MAAAESPTIRITATDSLNNWGLVGQTTLPSSARVVWMTPEGSADGPGASWGSEASDGWLWLSETGWVSVCGESLGGVGGVFVSTGADAPALARRPANKHPTG